MVRQFTNRREFIQQSASVCSAALISASGLRADEKKPFSTLKPGTLVIGTYHNFAPVCYREDGVAKGRDVVFMRKFAKSLGLKAEIKFFEFDGIWELPGKGQCDLVGAGIAPVKTRDLKGMTWSAPYFQVNRTLLIRDADKGRLKCMSDFVGKTIAVTKGSTADYDTVARKPASTEVVYYNDQAKAVQDLLDGKIDGFGEGDVSNEYLAAQHPGKLAVTDSHQMDPIETFALAVRDDSGILEALNKFIAENKGKY